MKERRILQKAGEGRNRRTEKEKGEGQFIFTESIGRRAVGGAVPSRNVDISTRW